MHERFREIPDEVWNFIIKTLPFSLAALAISISVQIKNKTAQLVGSILSAIIGLSCAWITGAWINEHFSSTVAPMIIGVVTITGEKIAYWLIYKFQFDLIGAAIVDYLINKFKKK